MIAELAMLTAELCEVVETVHYRGLTEREAATELGITRHQVRTQYAHSLARLRPHLRTLVADGAGI